MGEFLDTYDLSKLTKENIKHLSIFIMCSEIEAVIKNFQQRKVRARWIHCRILPDL
jgi:hypothetical protein